MMKKLSLKFILLDSDVFIGVGVVGLWCLSRLDAESKQSLADAISSVKPVKFTVENPCDYPQPKDRELEAEEAIYLGECFIIQNGYTDLPPIADKSKLTPENVFPGTDEEGIKMRHDSLERKAFSYERDNEFYGGSWVIVFRYKFRPNPANFHDGKLYESGRAVVMNFFGKRVRVQHSDYPLTMSTLRIINP